MYLEKLDIQGFKSFANKTSLSFPKRGSHSTPGIAAIVGPNGSGKSNVADAVRWVLGEQSVKLLRGKRAEDVIFSGSDKKARLGFAEVALHLNNEDEQAQVDYKHIEVKRRVYRDGNSEYYINGSKVRLTDVQLLLAQANFGQRTYSVIGQGMVDAVLSSTPQERKNFFDEATGVKQYQIKKEQAIHKIETTEENLSQATGLLREITPRLKSLERQMKRLEKRGTLEQDLRALQKTYYGSAWKQNSIQYEHFSDQKKKIEREHLEVTKKISELNAKLESLEKQQKHGDGSATESAQKAYRIALERKNEAIVELETIRREIELVAKTRPAAPAGIDYKKLAESAQKQITILKDIEKVDTLEKLNALKTKIRTLLDFLESIFSKPEAPDTKEIDALREKMKKAEHAAHDAERAVTEQQHVLQSIEKKQSSTTSGLFEIQRSYQTLQQKLNDVSNRKNTIEIELARIETHREDLESQIEKEVSETHRAAIKHYAGHEEKKDLWPDIAHIKHELEMIGGIDPEINEEYSETKERHDFLSTQITDLEIALKKTKQAVKELDDVINKEFDRAFSIIEKGFTEYFDILFSGGKAKLELNRENELESMSEEAAAALTDEEREMLAGQFRMGITIKASPPNKKVSSISMLSGGERALTSIALICAIIKANPSPFVVLDEVDAALDEANSIRFAEILERLAKITQFIAITHNRATMEKGSILYGVTMGDDGVSKLLSVDLDRAVKNAKQAA